MSPSTSKSPKRILFIAPHADDVEVLSASTCQAAVDLGWDVHQNLSCADEYGTDRPEFRGRRLAKIRKAEMNTVANMYGVDSEGKAKVTLHWMHYIDGHVPCTKESVAAYRKFIMDLKPDIILGPDPFLAVGRHQDHLATGKNYYFALKSIPPSQRPKIMLFFQSYQNDVFLKFTNWKHVYRLQMGHRSQFHPLGMKIFGIAGWLFWRRSFQAGWKMCDKFRRVRFDSDCHVPHFSWKDPGFILKHLFFTHLAAFGMPPGDYFKTPLVEDVLQDYQQNGWV
jgi:LmbE family N-acetylglucosaminyl deacetylase